MTTSGKCMQSRETGFASLIIAIVMVTVLSLLSIGFATLMRHEQQAALQQQLSKLAYYAAESGINDGIQAINAGFTTAKPNCDPVSGNQYLSNNVVDSSSSSSVKYSCLLIDPAPPDIKFSSVGRDDDDGKVMAITGVDASNNPKVIDKITISWSGEGLGPNFVPSSWFSNGTFPTDSNWKDSSGNAAVGVLRSQIVPLGTGSLTRAALTDNANTSYLYPNPAATGFTSTYSSPYSESKGTNAGKIYDGHCSAQKGPYYCSYTISGLAANNASSYLLRLDSLYHKSNVKIEVFDGLSGSQLRISGVQTQIDATGDARGTLKRIQVRVPTRSATYYPQSGIESMAGICKQLAVSPTYNNQNCTGLLYVPPTVPVAQLNPQNCHDPGDVVLDLDNSQSMAENWQVGSKLTKMKQVMQDFVDNTDVSSNNNHEAVLEFARATYVLQNMTSNTSALKSAIGGMQISTVFNTRYNLALNAAQTALQQGESRAGVKKILVFASDGLPSDDEDYRNALPSTILAITDQMKAQGIIIYTIAINTTANNVLLQAMSGNGGTFASATSEAQLDLIMNQIAGRISCPPDDSSTGPETGTPVTPVTTGPCASGGAYLWSHLEACGWPGPTNTGPIANTTLAVGVNGERDITTSNTTLQNETFSGNIVIGGTASKNVPVSNVTVKNVLLNFQGKGSAGNSAIRITSAASNVKIQNVRVVGGGKVHLCISTKGHDITIQAVDCSGTEDGLGSIDSSDMTAETASNMTIKDNYFHDFIPKEFNSPDYGSDGKTNNCKRSNGHVDGFQVAAGKNITLSHNTWNVTLNSRAYTVTPGDPNYVCPDTTDRKPYADGFPDSVMAIWSAYGDLDNVKVDTNLIAGGGFVFYAYDRSPSGDNPVGGYSTTNINIDNNRFSNYFYECIGTHGLYFYNTAQPYLGGPTDGWRRSGNTVIEKGLNVDSGNPKLKNNGTSVCN
ncbi:MAG: clumping factor [Candidatus Saccharibacteria bacterium]|nr:clumping factor [Candidatus Saccharibacteria bacterium]